MNLPIVAIIGRPNVGKSTLFNCLVKAKRAIISPIPGTTRDSLMEKIKGDKTSYYIVDTAGLTNNQGDSLENEIQTQVELSITRANLIVFLVDGKKELTQDDEDIVQKLRKSRIPVLFVANKIDDGQADQTLELAKFGFGVPLTISAKNFTGIWELEEAIEDRLPEYKEEEPAGQQIIKLAFIGRPNVGKSSLKNSLLGQNRSVVSEIAGTTRDTIDTEFIWKDQDFLLLDTAGLRRPGKIERDLEFWSSVRTKSAIERSDVCALIIDALDGVTHQDLAIASQIIEEGKGLILCVNKLDLIQEKTKTKEETDDRELDEIKMWGEDLDKVRKKYSDYLASRFTFAPWAPVVFCSAKTKKGTDKILESATGIYQEREKRITTAELNRFIPGIYHSHVVPMVGTKTGKIKFVEQVETSPPRFLFFVNNTKAFHFSYRRFLENKIREKYGFWGTPLQIEFRDSMEKAPKRRK
ncbi:ribosome biogenesis GTPase Der [Candidatus Gracilibacteria bacterium]|nr:ribosome biogenesis GTPase Der [Candidatus Gracilibacteria bacterium]